MPGKIHGNPIRLNSYFPMMVNKISKFSLIGLLAFTGVVFICLLGYFVWINIKSQPKATQEQLYAGIVYTRDVRSSPRNIVIHIIKVDLRAEGVRFLVTPGNPKNDLPVNARTTSEFLKINGLQVAINGDGFTPWYSKNILDYYPRSGENVDPIGFAASEGIAYSQSTDNEPTLYLSASNQARINNKIGKIFNAISGNQHLVKNGKAIDQLGDDYPDPRTAVALDRSNRHLILIVVDGRQPGYSEGITLGELAEIIIHHGGYSAINLDGGGSSTMVIGTPSGITKVINSPINHGIPGRQRSVGNHLGIYAKSPKND